MFSRKTDLHIESAPWRIVHGADLSMICTSNKKSGMLSPNKDKAVYFSFMPPM